MTKLLAGFLLVMMCYACTMEKQEISSLPEYGEKDFEMAKEMFQKDSALMQKIDEGIAKGDTTAIQARWILNATFKEAMNHPQISKDDVMAMIHSAVIMKETLSKFEEINQQLEKLNGGGKADSLMRLLDSLSAKLEQEVPSANRGSTSK